MKILIISQMFPCKRHSTSGIFFANLIKELAPKLDGLIVVTPRPYIPRVLTKIKKDWSKWYLDPMISKCDDMEIIRPYTVSFPRKRHEGLNGILMYLSLFALIKKLVEMRNIEMILAYNMLPEGIAAVMLARRLKVPVGFWCIGSDVNDFARCSRLNFFLTKKHLRESDIVLTESKDLERKVKEIAAVPVHAQTFYKGIDVSNFQDLPPRGKVIKELGFEENRRYILFAGRMIFDKGIYELAEAFALIAKKYPDVDLVFVGEEIEKDGLTKKLLNLGILDRIFFAGMIPYRKIAYYMKVAELLVLPTWAEGLPNVILEAMAIGLPVVTTNVGGIPEIIEDGVTGLSVPPRNAQKLADAMSRMIEDNTLRERCVNHGKKIIFDRFDVKKNAVVLYDLLRKVRDGDRSAKELQR